MHQIIKSKVITVNQSKIPNLYHFPWDQSHNGGTGPSDKGTSPRKMMRKAILD